MSTGCELVRSPCTDSFGLDSEQGVLRTHASLVCGNWSRELSCVGSLYPWRVESEVPFPLTWKECVIHIVLHVCLRFIIKNDAFEHATFA